MPRNPCWSCMGPRDLKLRPPRCPATPPPVTLSIQVVGLREVDVHDVDVLQQLVEHAAASRSTGSTGANDESSR